MKKIYFISLLIMSFSFAQEDRNKRDWNPKTQTTYSIEEKKDKQGFPASSNFNGFENNRSNVNNTNSDAVYNDISHRPKSIWSDASTIVSDEKTGHHPYIPYTYVSEDDILWAKRVVKWIDIRILQNHPLYFPVEVPYGDYLGWDGAGGSMESGTGGTPNFNEVLSGIDARKSLFQILKDAATTIDPATGQPLVSTYNMTLTRKLTAQEVIPNWEKNYSNAFGFIKQENADDDGEDNNGNGEIDEEGEMATMKFWYEPKHVIGYYVEEEVFFDKRRSKLDSRYISITPSVYHGVDGQERDLPTFFFPEIRSLLANHKVFPPNGNMAQRMSFDEFFHRKLFASAIKKETNVYDRKISDYLRGRSLEQLLEGRKIKDQIRRYESDMWQY